MIDQIKKHPFIAITLAVIATFGGAMAFFDNLTKLRHMIYPEPIDLAENYWFIKLNEDNRYSLSAEEDLSLLKKDIISKVGKQLPSYHLIANDVLSSAFSIKTYNNIQTQFCNELLNSESIAEQEFQLCLDQSGIQSPSLAIYAVTNSSTRLARDIVVNYKILSKKGRSVILYDQFIDEAVLETGCLMYRSQDGENTCLLRDLGKTGSLEIDNLNPGETLFVPMYVWSAAYFYLEPEHQLSNFDGYISGEYFIFPDTVYESGQLVIQKARKMIETPSIMLGEHETRG